MATTRTPLDALDAALQPLANETETLNPFALGGAGKGSPDEPESRPTEDGFVGNVGTCPVDDLELILKALPDKWRERIIQPEPPGSDRSRTLFRVIKELGQRGFNAETIERLIRMHPEGIGAKYAERSDLDKEIVRILQKQSWRQALLEQTRAARTGKPVLQLIAGLLPELIDQAESHLIAANLEIYQRGDLVVRPGVVERRTAAGEKLRMPGLVPVTPYNMVELFTKVIDFQMWDGRSEEWRSVDCPLPFATAYLQRMRHWRLRQLTAIMTAPTLRPDGSILETPGYDEQTGILYDPLGVEFPPVPQYPSEEDALLALEELKRPLGEIPFELDPEGHDDVTDFSQSSAGRSVALSIALTGLIRPSLRTAPLHGKSAPVAGSGKSKVVNFATIIITGHEAGSFVPSEDEVELAKQIGAALIAGDPVIALDNCDHVLQSAVLAQALTEILVKVRILGRSEMCTVLNTALFTVTGNNLKLAGDLPRRSLRGVIDPQVERPELREFASEDPINVARRERPRLVVAGLTMLRAYYIARGKPLSRPLGSFEDWSRWVRDCLIWLGESDPCLTMGAIRDEDPALTALTAVMTQWESCLGRGEFTVRQIIARATWSEGEGVLPGVEELNPVPDFREALLVVAGKNGAINSQKLGNWLGKNKDRIVDKRRIVRANILDGYIRWRLDFTL
ncbi:MAG: hypothetical protein WB611_22120 [Stellaceae bacterium]